MILRFHLYGGLDRETEKVKKILDVRNISYRAEIDTKENYSGPVALITPAGRFVGFDYINFVFGKRG